MQALEKQLRGQLERAVKDARDIAESAARATLEQLGVGEAKPFAHLDEEERDLRRRLRVHGRQLGDARHASTDVQEIDRLIEEVAYEHWHRMLFARFLAENNLLMYPDPDDPVAVTLEECEDLAADEGAANGWELAARYAARMLPQIFCTDSPVFQLTLPPEYQQRLERLVAGLPPEAFTASDALGWVYQFWQAKRKDEVNASEVKIGARELPAVTQLFTEPYMVGFLLDNFLGAWWAARRLTEHDLQTAQSEQELRDRASIPGVSLDYLRFVQKEGTWSPAAGTFDGWPEHLCELKTLAPCCGSGHFLVAAFLMLVPMRMELEGLSAQESVDAVLRENIYGLEIDQRCVELAAFALALGAWRYPDAGGYRALPDLNIACSGLSVRAAKDVWKELALGKHNLRIALDWIYDAFRDAPVLGSLLDPTKTAAAKIVHWDDLSIVLKQALEQEQSDEQHEVAVVAQGLAKTATLLASQYHWVITNVPYLKRGKQDEVLRGYCEKYCPSGKNDLATVFLERCVELCYERGTVSLVLPQNWLFLTTYKELRENLLKHETWNFIARLGPGAFETISGEVVKAILLILSRGNVAVDYKSLFGESNGGNQLRGLDVSECRSSAVKAARLLEDEIKHANQLTLLGSLDARVSFDQASGEYLEKYSVALNGLHGGDSLRFRFYFLECNNFDDWKFLQNTLDGTLYFGGRTQIFYWPNGGMLHRDNAKARIQGDFAWGKHGIAISMMGDLPCTSYTGELFDISCSPIIPNNPSNLPAIWCFCSSPEYNEAVRRIDQQLKVINATLVKVPIDLARWAKIAEKQYPNGLPQPYSDDPTQWIFHGNPCGSVVWGDDSKTTAEGPLRANDTVPQVAVARLLGYRWPAELDASMELADEQRECVNRCEALLHFADEDGIACIPPVRGEASAADRLLNLLAAAYGEAWFNDTLAELLKNSAHAGKTLEIWLRDKFFAQHCKLFQHRPFIWHIWDGLRDGFAALINYHKFDAKSLETLIYTYLGDWISRQKQDIANGIDGAQEKLDAAESLKKKLELILEGEAPHDIFVRWKPIEQQPIGWNPDLNDGVRLNIRPFMSVPDVGKKGAGALRDKPNIKWRKDRGKDVESAPWFHLFKGDRIDDRHLSLVDKRAARDIAE